jgi:hypothetical protein
MKRIPLSGEQELPKLVQLDRIRQIALCLLERAHFAPAQRLGPLLPAPLAVGVLDRHE